MARLIGYPDAGASVWSDGSPASVILNAEFFDAPAGAAVCTVDNATSGQTISSPTVTFTAVCVPDNATSAQTITSPTVTFTSVAVPDNATSAQTITSPTVTVPGAVSTPLHGRRLRGRTLTLPGDRDYLAPTEPEAADEAVAPVLAVVPAMLAPSVAADVALVAVQAAEAETLRLVEDAAERDRQRLLTVAANELAAQIAASREAEARHRARLIADDEWLLLAA